MRRPSAGHLPEDGPSAQAMTRDDFESEIIARRHRGRARVSAFIGVHAHAASQRQLPNRAPGQRRRPAAPTRRRQTNGAQPVDDLQVDGNSALPVAREAGGPGSRLATIGRGAMERIPAASRALIRCGGYAAASFRAAPTATNVASGTPQRQLVNWYRSLCSSAHRHRRMARSMHSASVSEPTTPVRSNEPLTIAATNHGQATASSSARSRRPGQSAASGTGARAYNNHMIRCLRWAGLQPKRSIRPSTKPTTAVANTGYCTVTVCFSAARRCVSIEPSRRGAPATTDRPRNAAMQLRSGQRGSIALYMRPSHPVSRAFSVNARCLWTLTNSRILRASASPAHTAVRLKLTTSKCSRPTKYTCSAAMHASDAFTCCSPSVTTAPKNAH